MDNNVTNDITLKAFSSNPRNIYITDEVCAETLSQLKKDLFDIETNDLNIVEENYNKLVLINKKVADAYKNSVVFPPIIINVCSPGGSVYSGFGMYDLIKRYDDNPKYDMTIVINGFAASMATLFILGCKKRIASPNTSFLIHSASSFMGGKLEEVIDDVTEFKRIDKLCKQIYTSNTKLTEAKLKEIDKYRKDWWLSAEEALEYGIITEIK